MNLRFHLELIFPADLQRCISHLLDFSCWYAKMHCIAEDRWLRWCLVGGWWFKWYIADIFLESDDAWWSKWWQKFGAELIHQLANTGVVYQLTAHIQFCQGWPCIYDICTLNNFRSNIDGVYHITDWFLKTFVQIHLPWNKVRMLSDFIIFSLWAASPRWSPCIIFTLMHIAQVPENQLQLLRPYQARVQKSLEKLDVPGLSINLIILIILIIMIIILLIMFTLIIINESVNIIGLKPCLSITNQHYIVSSSTNSF